MNILRSGADMGYKKPFNYGIISPYTYHPVGDVLNWYITIVISTNGA